MTPNITSVSFTYHNEVKREEYGPIKKAEAAISAAVGESEDGAVILALIANIAEAKVREKLLLSPATGPLASPPISELASSLSTPASLSAAISQAVEAPKRTRRTAAQIAADEAAAAAANQATAEKLEAALSAPQGGPTPSGGEPATAGGDGDDWIVGENATEVTDQELLQSCSKRGAELGGRTKIIELIDSYRNIPAGPPFKVQMIDQAHRREFLTKLAALTA